MNNKGPSSIWSFFSSRSPSSPLHKVDLHNLYIPSYFLNNSFVYHKDSKGNYNYKFDKI